MVASSQRPISSSRAAQGHPAPRWPRCSGTLNKGESVHTLRQDLRFAHAGAFHSPHLPGQSEQAWCLTLLTNAVVTWTTEYHGLTVVAPRAERRTVDDEVLAHICPVHSENVNFFGVVASTSRANW